jgi:hypothetical protein
MRPTSLRAAGPISRWVPLVITIALVAPAFGRSAAPRKLAKQHVDETIARVRQAMTSDPVKLESDLIDWLAIPVGDDPRVLPLCREIVEKTTSTENYQAVAHALTIISRDHMRLFSGRGKQKDQIGEIARIIMGRDDWGLKDRAAFVLGSLGGSFAGEAERYYSDILRSPMPRGQAESPRRDAEYRSAIRELVLLKRKGAYSLIRKVTTKYGLLDSFKKWVAEDPQRRAPYAHNDRFLKAWEKVMAEGR